MLDISAGTKQDQQASDFPNGVPCAADSIMQGWMGYVYQQQAKPTSFQGVTVSIDAIDPNNNLIHIGDANTTDTGIYTYTWAPPSIPGNYLITATFGGTNAYWGSSAQTGMTIQNAVSVTPTATPMNNVATTSDLMTYTLGSAIAVIIALAVAVVLMLRKKP